MTFCTGCGDTVTSNTCCRNCKVGQSKRVKETPEVRRHIRHAYWQADMKPKRISRITGVPQERVIEIIQQRETL